MGEGTGAEVVREIRAFEELTQILLVTGYASEQPARTLLEELDIQGYHDKSDGPARLMVLADAALKHYRVVERLRRQGAYLRHIVAVSPEINRLQPSGELLQAALTNVTLLLSGGHGVLATANSGLFVLDDDEGAEIAIRAASGRFSSMRTLGELPQPYIEAIRDGLRADVPRAHRSGCVLIPLETRSRDRGCMLVDASLLPDEAVEACQIFADQVVQALENVLLYERATVDHLTGVYNRAHGLQRLEEVLRLASRTSDATSVVFLDIDHFKALNDTHGHAAGDIVLRRVAQALAGECRASDVISRHGGEEFMVTLPATDLAGGRIVAEKLRARIEALAVQSDDTVLSVTISAGVTVVPAGEIDLEALLARADAALYQSKRGGRNRITTFEEMDDGRLRQVCR
jgi:two-component system, cell cycle response regulator